MKFFILLLFISFASFSQDNAAVHQLTRTLALQEYDLTNMPPTTIGSLVIIQKGWRFEIDHSDTNGHFITFLKWEGKNNINNQKIYANVSTVSVIQKNKTSKNVKQEKIKIYYISNSDFDDHTEIFEEENPLLSFVTGAITIPIKVRPGGNKLDSEGNKIRPFDFTGDFNIGLSIGLRIRLDKKGKGFLIPSAGINLTSVSIDENTVRNSVISSKTNASSLTPFIGFIGEYENFQVALITGWDRLSGSTGENWIYQGKPWFGIGLGYRIFNTTNNNPERNLDD